MLTALILAAACSGDCTAQKQFKAMEDALTEAPVAGKIHAHAEGSVSADLDANLKFTEKTHVDFKGNLMGQDVEKDWDANTTPELRDSLLIGLTRMGLLHNLVNLSRNRPPIEIDGGVRDSLTAYDFAKTRDGGISYKLRIGKAPNAREMGEGTIKFDPKTRLPVSRTLVGHLDKGEMRVTEKYDLKRTK